MTFHVDTNQTPILHLNIFHARQSPKWEMLPICRNRKTQTYVVVSRCLRLNPIETQSFLIQSIRAAREALRMQEKSTLLRNDLLHNYKSAIQLKHKEH